MLDSSWWNKPSRTYQDFDQRNFYLFDQKKFRLSSYFYVKVTKITLKIMLTSLIPNKYSAWLLKKYSCLQYLPLSGHL